MIDNIYCLILRKIIRIDIMAGRFRVISGGRGSGETNVWKTMPSQLINIKCYFLCGISSWLIFPLFIMFWFYLKTKYTVYELTNERLIITRGVFNKSTEQIELYRVKDIHLHEPFLMRVFNLGNIELETSDKLLDNILLPAIYNSKIVKEKIRLNIEKQRTLKRVREMDIR